VDHQYLYELIILRIADDSLVLTLDDQACGPILISPLSERLNLGPLYVEIEVNGANISLDSGRSVADGGVLQHTSDIQPGVKIERRFSQQGEGGIRVESRLVNDSDWDVVLNRIELLAAMADEGSALFGNPRGARIYEQDNYSARVRSPGDDEVNHSSSNVWELYDPEEGFALCIGFGSEERWRGRIITGEPTDSIFSLKVGFDGGDTVVSAGEEVKLEDVLILGGGDPWALLERYADLVAELRGVNFPDEIPVSWCSWYPFRLGVTEESVLANAEVASCRHLGRLGLDIIEVDLGWERGKLPNTFEENEQFGRGLGWLAEELDRLGFRLGAWVAPFAISEFSDCAEQHPEWLLGGEDGDPLPRGEWYWEPHGKIYGLDLTHPGARRWLEDNIRSLSTRGVRYLKTDFLGVAGDAALRHRHDPRIVAGGGSEAMRMGLEIMRREVQSDHPEALLLNCSGPELPGTGAFPLLYICNDTGNTGYVGWAHHRRNYGHNLAGHLFKHRRWGIVQPSCLCVGPPGTLEEARLRATATFLSGGQVDIGDDLTTLPEARWQVLLSCLPTLGISARPVDLFEPVEGSSLKYDAMTRGEDFAMDQPELEGSRIWHLPVSTGWDDWHLMGVFSYEGDDTKGEVSITNYRIPLEKIGLDPGREYWAHEFWSGQFLGSIPAERTSPGGYLHPGDAQVPIVTRDRDNLDISFFGPSARLLIIRSKREHPWIVGTTFHQSGGCELESVKWDGERLAGKLSRPPGIQGKIFAVGCGNEVQSAAVNGKDSVVYGAANGSLVLPIQTRMENHWEILFKRAS
jgi:hypothetical protein